MTIQNITDSEIALKAGWEQERNVSDQLARERDTLKIELSEAQAERTKYRNEYATCHAAWQLMKQERDTLQARVAELEALIEASRKQEAVAFLVMRYEGGHENLETTSDGVTNSFPVYAAPVIAPDVLKDAERYRYLFDGNKVYSQFARAYEGWDGSGGKEGFDSAIDAAKGGAND